MLIAGSWLMRHDGTARPIVRAEVWGHDQSIVAEDFLVDSGADITVFSAALMNRLQLPVHPMPPDTALRGVGGGTGAVMLSTKMEFTTVDNHRASVRAHFAAFTELAAADQSLLGRDVLDNFDVIVSRRRDQVLLLAFQHQYRVEQAE